MCRIRHPPLLTFINLRHSPFLSRSPEENTTGMNGTAASAVARHAMFSRRAWASVRSDKQPLRRLLASRPEMTDTTRTSYSSAATAKLPLGGVLMLFHLADPAPVTMGSSSACSVDSDFKPATKLCSIASCQPVFKFFSLSIFSSCPTLLLLAQSLQLPVYG